MSSGFHERYSPLQQREENDQEVEALRSKVHRLKEITIDINQEVTRQNHMFDEMNADLDDLKHKLGRVIDGVKDLIKMGSNSRYFWYAVATFVALLFFIIIFKR